MYKNKKILGIIPARGGSKGLPGKNIKPLAGVPLIGWTIKSAKQSKYFDRVVVSTDDTKIASIAKSLGGDVPFMRPKSLARDNSPSIDAIKHVIDTLKSQGEAYDYIALIEPTSPLRKDTDFDRAIAALIDRSSQADSLVSVGEVHMEHPVIVRKIKQGYVKPYVKTLKKITRRQDLDKAYFPYGVIYLSKASSLIKTGTFYQRRTIPFMIERWQNYEIDDLYDFICIEAIMASTNGGKARA